MVFGIIYVIKSAVTAFRNKLAFTKSGMTMQFGKETFQVQWELVKAVSFAGKGGTRSVTVFMESQNLYIPLNLFDEKKVKDEFKEYLPPSVFDPQAFRSLPQIIEWRKDATRKFENIQRSLKVSLGGWERWVGIITACGGVALALFFYFSSNDAIGVSMSAFFGGLGLLLAILCSGWIECTNEGISVSSLFRKYELSWGTLKEIFIDSNHGIVALVSDECRMILPSPSSWLGKDKELLRELINYKIDASKIQPIENSAIVYWHSKNIK